MISVAQLPPPACEDGYPWSQLATILNEQELARLDIWMQGQTMCFCGGQKYDHDTKSYHESCGGIAHGSVVYPHDLIRWIEAGPIID